MTAPETCAYCAEQLPPGAARCPACGESREKVSAADELGPPAPLGPKLIAWFSLLFGGLGLFGPFVTFFMYVVLPPDPNDPVRAMAEAEPLFKGWIFLSQGLSFLLSVGLLASGIGLLSWREWARTLGLRVAKAELVLLLLSSTITGLVFARSLADGAGAGGMAPMLQAVALGAVLFGACFGAILPVATLLVLRRPENVEFFAAREAERAAK